MAGSVSWRHPGHLMYPLGMERSSAWCSMVLSMQGLHMMQLQALCCLTWSGGYSSMQMTQEWYSVTALDSGGVIGETWVGVKGAGIEASSLLKLSRSPSPDPAFINGFRSAAVASIRLGDSGVLASILEEETSSLEPVGLLRGTEGKAGV